MQKPFDDVEQARMLLARAGIVVPAEDLRPIGDALTRHWQRMAPILAFEDWERDPALTHVVAPDTGADR